MRDEVAIDLEDYEPIKKSQDFMQSFIIASLPLGRYHDCHKYRLRIKTKKVLGCRT